MTQRLYRIVAPLSPANHSREATRHQFVNPKCYKQKTVFRRPYERMSTPRCRQAVTRSQSFGSTLGVFRSGEQFGYSRVIVRIPQQSGVTKVSGAKGRPDCGNSMEMFTEE